MPAWVGNFVWHDLNRNGIQDEREPGINGVTVKAYRAGTAELLATRVTQSAEGQDGTFAFAFEPPIVVSLKFELPLGYDFTVPRRGEDRARDSDVDPFSGETEPIRIEAGAEGKLHGDWDAGLVQRLIE